MIIPQIYVFKDNARYQSINTIITQLSLYNFYYTMATEVTDGTRCNDYSTDICVQGQCKVTAFKYYCYPTVYIQLLLYNGY